MCGEGFFFRLFIFLRFDKFLVTHVPKNPSREGLAQLHSDPKITLDSQKLQKNYVVQCTWESRDSPLLYVNPDSDEHLSWHLLKDMLFQFLGSQI